MNAETQRDMYYLNQQARYQRRERTREMVVVICIVFFAGFASAYNF